MCFNTEVLTQYLNSRIRLLASLLSFPLYLYHFHNYRIAYNDRRNQKNRMAIAPVCSLQCHCEGYKLIFYGRLLMHARRLWTVKKPCKEKVKRRETSSRSSHLFSCNVLAGCVSCPWRVEYLWWNPLEDHLIM